jgi:hypothetical protein
MSSNPTPRKSRIFYGWYVLAAFFLIISAVMAAIAVVSAMLIRQSREAVS